MVERLLNLTENNNPYFRSDGIFIGNTPPVPILPNYLPMPKTLRHFRDMLSGQQPEYALRELQGWMAAGDREVMQRLNRLRREPRERLRADALNEFIDEIENGFPQLNLFLSHYHAATEAVAARQWGSAEEHLRQAIELHQPDYLAHRDDLTRKLSAIQEQLALEELVSRGNEAYLQKDWKAALEAFQAAQGKDFKGSRWTREELEAAIANCRKALSFEQHLSRAKEAQEARLWTDARSEFQAALACHMSAFEPSQDVLRAEIEWTARQARLSARSQAPESTLLMMTRRFLFPALLTAVVVAIAWLFWEYSGSLPADSGQGDSFVASATEPGAESIPSEAMVPPEQEAAVQEEQLAFEQPELPPVVENTELLAAASPLPPARLSWQGVAEAGQAVSFQIDNYNPAVRYQIDWGNGEKQQMGKSAQHTFAAPGLYQVQIQATDASGGGSLLTQTIRVEAPAAILARDSGVARPAAAQPVTPSAPSPVSSAAPAPALAPARPAAAAPAAASAVLDLAEVMPQFPGGAPALKSYLARQTRYPDQARERDIQGKVYVQFVVQPDGSLTAVRVARGIGFGCDEEALRLVNSMPRWTPGKQGGSPVAVRYTLPIIFQLQ